MGAPNTRAADNNYEDVPIAHSPKCDGENKHSIGHSLKLDCRSGTGVPVYVSDCHLWYQQPFAVQRACQLLIGGRAILLTVEEVQMLLQLQVGCNIPMR